MIIQLQKFGSILSSREAGQEAFNAFRPSLDALGKDEAIEIDFADIGTLSPSWADEFLCKLQDIFGDRLVLFPTENLSAKASISMLESIRGKKFKLKSGPMVNS
jgi:hypothetical protein